MEARRQQNRIFKVMTESNFNLEFYYQGKLLSKNEGKMKIFSDKQKLIEFISSRHAWRQTGKLLQAEENGLGQQLEYARGTEKHWGGS